MSNHRSSLANRRRQGLFRDEFRQDHVLVGLRCGIHANGRERRCVGAERVATTGKVSSDHLLVLIESDRAQLHFVGSEEIGEVQLVGGSDLHAHGRAGQRQRAARAETLRHQEALAVVVVDHREVQACHGVSGQRVGRVPRQQIDLAGLQRGQPHLRVQRHIADFRVVAKNRRRDRPADIDV